MKNTNKNKLRIGILFTLFFLMLSSVSALNLDFNQNSNINDYKNEGTGNRVVYDLVGSVDDIIEIYDDNFTLISSYNYDVEIEISDVVEDFYIVIPNNEINRTMTFMWQGDLTKDDTLYVQNVTFNQVGNYYFRFSPAYPNEPAHIYVNAVAPSYISTFFYSEEKPQGFSNLMGGFVSAFTDVIEINVQFWKVIFYGAILTITLLVLFMLIRIGFAFFEIAKKMRTDSNRNPFDDSLRED